MSDVLDQLLDLDRSQLEPGELEHLNSVEMREWLESLDYVLASGGPARVKEIIAAIEAHAEQNGVALPFETDTSYVNTIAAADQPDYPGDLDIEKRIINMIRWNAMAMVVYGNKKSPGIGGHIATYASAANLYEVGF
ncbi:MAG TPA: pyruvate dehydrogenase (acetyl-transferring), homodimeric type, partial [Trueperaceae bacterium]|nr:pyruvate dehydrogenase (acetyl-transferring), homodimeric type [Trueperaceae bacterium]